MKRLLMLVLSFAFVFAAHAEKPKPLRMVTVVNTCTGSPHAYPEYSIRQVETVPLDSLLKADQLQGTVPSEWTLQRSPLYGDTIVVVGLVITPAANVSPEAGLTYTAHGWTMLLHDPAANSNYFGGALVRAGCPSSDCPDTAQAFLDGFTTPQRGNIVKMTVVVEEFPSPAPNPVADNMNSMTQLRPIPCYPIEFVDANIHAIPKPTHLSITDFYEGGYPGGKVKYSTGEPYEASLVELTNVKVDNLISTTHGNGFPANTWSMTEADGSGNSIADYDASHYFTYGNENPGIAGDPSFARPPIFAVIDTIRGTMITVSGLENPRGYRISPLFPGDVQYGISLPTLATHRRYPVTVRSTDTVQVTARATETAGGFPISRVVLVWSQTAINGSTFGAWRGDTMVVIDTAHTYSANIWDFPDHNPLEAGITVRYYIKAIDDHGNSSILANSAGQDSSKGFFFYKVKNTPYTIHDIQYTPYRNGRS